MSDLRLYLFERGTFKFHNINQGLKEPYEIPVPGFLFSTKRGSGKISIDRDCAGISSKDHSQTIAIAFRNARIDD